ncbi:putative RNA methyltransferase [Granulicoccus sp. GXG6511]|uniref:putative RNA methyltransferase n=1 Tax=Granulicoccus sp. GXG6511 TaxID=3381351 RepID=UPI003D7F1221
MLTDVIDLLHCPHCTGELTLTGGTAGCPAGHRFDVARQGQLNLLRRSAGANADTAAMVADRVAFLAAGHYAPIAELVASAAVGSVAVEAGAGTGYYLDAVVSRLARTAPGARGLATDVSTYASRRAAKLPRIGAVVADTWAGLPIRSGIADTVLAVFAPRNLEEFARICAPSGRVLVVTPLPAHLAEVRHTAGLMTIEEGKHERLLAEARTCLTHDRHEDLCYRIDLSPDEQRHLIGMGPNAFHTQPAGRPETSIATTVAVRLDVFRHPAASTAPGRGQRAV